MAGQRELLECFVCGQDNGAIVSTGALPVCRGPQRLQHPDLQRGPCHPAATQGSPSGLEGEWVKDILLFEESGRPPSPSRLYTRTAHWVRLGKRTWLPPPQHPCPPALTGHWSKEAAPLLTHWEHLFIPTPPLQKKKKKKKGAQQVCIGLLVLGPDSPAV